MDGLVIDVNRAVKCRDKLVSDKEENLNRIIVFLNVLRPAGITGRLFWWISCTVNLAAAFAINSAFIVPIYGVDQFFSATSACFASISPIVASESATNLANFSTRTIRRTLFSLVHGISLPFASKRFSHATIQ